MGQNEVMKVAATGAIRGPRTASTLVNRSARLVQAEKQQAPPGVLFEVWKLCQGVVICRGKVRLVCASSWGFPVFQTLVEPTVDMICERVMCRQKRRSEAYAHQQGDGASRKEASVCSL